VAATDHKGVSILADNSETDPAEPPARRAAEASAFTLVNLSVYAVDDAYIAALIADYPLAWVLPRCAGAGQPHLLPLLAQTDEAGRVTTLIGHMGRRNPLVRAFEASPEALILFTGPQAYVSSACVSNPRWAPTWNYAQVRLEAKVVLESDGGDAALLALVEKMDAEERTGWRPPDVGPRYRAMEQAIIAFRAEVTRIEPRFKLGQDEPLETLREILAAHPDPELVRWMRRANRKRL
jgi:transcriptional regulator